MRPIQRVRGFALMMAVFMIVTLAAIGLYLVTISTGQQMAVLQDEQGVRAYQAARAGLEVSAYQLLRSNTCTPPVQRLTLIQGLNGFFAEVGCVAVSAGETDGGAEITVYRITSTGCNANPCTPASPAATYVERQLQITITCPTVGPSCI